MTTYTDADQVERLLKHAIGYGSIPDLSPTQITDMVELALDGDAYTSEGMQRAVVTAWGWKVGLTSDKYDLSGAGGSKLTESQWHAQCAAMATRYRVGDLSVDGQTLGQSLSDPDYGSIVTVSSNYLTGSSLYDSGGEF